MKDYILDHYGTCQLGPMCVCIRPLQPWLGRGCYNWTPLGVTTYEQLHEYIRRERDGTGDT
jgi:hypothetical protein